MKMVGLLVLTRLSKLSEALTLARKKVTQNLYIHYHPKEPLKYDKMSKVRDKNKIGYRNEKKIDKNVTVSVYT